MAASTTEIANLALRHLAVSKPIADLDSERSKEANAIRAFYEETRDQVLRDFPWPFATTFVTLALVEEEPTSEWAFSYRMPSDKLRFRRILSGARQDTPDTRIPYRIGRDASGELIYTDAEEAEAEYTARITDVSAFAADFTAALAFLLAAQAGPSITGGDQFQLADRALNLYVRAITQARANALNEEAPDLPPDAEWIRGRE